MTKQEIENLVFKDESMMEILNTAKQIDLMDWMIGAGFIRNKVWDYLHGRIDPTVSTDIDLIYFDSSNTSEDFEKTVEQELNNILNAPWSVKNMARMHDVNGDPPYVSASDGLAHWVETATCVAVKLNNQNQVEVIAPHGIEDLVNLVLRPSPSVHRVQDFYARVEKKQWLLKWPKLKIVMEK